MHTQLPDKPEKVKALKILLVEDDEVNTEVVMDMLSMLGFSVEHANNGCQALELYDTSQPALILMDCEMPVMDGYETIRQLRQIERDHHKAPVPVIALTAHSATDTYTKCLASGMNDFLGKPFTMHDLHAILNKWLYNHDIETPDNRTTTSNNADRPVNITDTINKPAILDHCVLEKLRRRQEQRKSSLMTRVINSYLEQSSRLIEELITATASTDIETISRISHTLKSSSINVGATVLSNLCHRLEQQCANEIIDDALIRQIYTVYHDVRDALVEVLTSAGQQDE